jgi:tetratricopeptide (TPR) repeat protein
MVSFQKAIAQIFMGDFIPARQCFEQLMPYYEAQGDELYVAALHMNLGTISLLEGKYIESREHFEQGLETYRQIGSFFGEATTFAYLSWLAFHEQRYIPALNWGQRVLTAMRDIGEVIREAAALVDVGNVYARLGQWETAQTHYEQALALSRPVNNRNTEIGALYNLSLLTGQLGDFQQALALSKQALQMVEGSGDRYLHAHCLTVQGRALESLGQIEAALDAYTAALTLRHEMNQFNLIAELRALLAHLHLHQGDLEQAMACIEDVLELLGFSERPNNLTGHPAVLSIERLHGVQAPNQVCLICYEVLVANGDERSKAILDFAANLLKEQADQLDDPVFKQSFLENVPVNSQIIAYSLQAVS